MHCHDLVPSDPLSPSHYLYANTTPFIHDRQKARMLRKLQPRSCPTGDPLCPLLLTVALLTFRVQLDCWLGWDEEISLDSS